MPLNIHFSILKEIILGENFFGLNLYKLGEQYLNNKNKLFLGKHGVYAQFNTIQCSSAQFSRVQYKSVKFSTGQ